MLRRERAQQSLGDQLRDPNFHGSDRLIWSLAMPVLAQNFLGMFVGWSDTILAGQILGGEVYLAAGIVAGYLLWLLECISSLIYMGSHAIIARLLGANRPEEASHILGQSLFLSVLLGLPMSAAVWLHADQAAALMQLQGKSASAVAEYLRIVSYACVPMTIMIVGTSGLRAAGHNVAVMWIYLAVNAVNIICSWILAVGAGPIPALGWWGIAAGTSASFYIGGAATIGLLARGVDGLQAPNDWWRADASAIARILRIGIPGAGSSLVIVLCQLWFLAIIGSLGDTATAAHGVAIRCESMSWLWGESFSIAAATLVGQSLGARRPDLAEHFGWRSFILSTIILSVFGLVFLIFADLLVMIFTGSDVPEVRHLGAQVLRLVALGMPALSASIVLTGALRGAGDTRGPFLYNTIGMLLFRVPFAWALTGGVVAWGLFGAWIGMVADLYARGFLSWSRYRVGRWKRLAV